MENLFRYDSNLNINAFSRMLNDPTECYKFYWFDSIMQLLATNRELFTFDEIINGMIADAWYSVTEYHLRLGPQNEKNESMNSIERAINKLKIVLDTEKTVSREQLLELIECNNQLIYEEKKQLALNVPYRLLSSFLCELDGDNVLWSQKRKLIKHISEVNEFDLLPYTIVDGRSLKKEIIINPLWHSYLIENMVPIRGWIRIKKISYLQDRNPGVPGIVYKLDVENDKQRKLKHVRQLWQSVIDTKPVKDIYSNLELTEEFDIDHFIPWSYISNDEIWNLIPTKPELNSSKNNRLPLWKDYFSGFSRTQFLLNEAIHEFPEICELFYSCRRDNIHTMWPIEELYCKNISINRFTNILEKNLRPIYDAALIQGYQIWHQT